MTDMDIVSIRGHVDVTVTYHARIYVVRVIPLINGYIDADLWMGEVRLYSIRGLYLPYLPVMWRDIWESILATGCLSQGDAPPGEGSAPSRP